MGEGAAPFLRRFGGAAGPNFPATNFRCGGSGSHEHDVATSTAFMQGSDDDTE